MIFNFCLSTAFSVIAMATKGQKKSCSLLLIVKNDRILASEILTGL